MANVKFSSFVSAGPLDGTETLVGLKSSLNNRFPITFFPFTVKVTVVSAEILQLFTTPKTLVAAPGAGFMILPVNVTYFLHAGGIVYATTTDLNLSLNGSIDTTASGLLSSAADKIEVRSPVFTNNNAVAVNAALKLACLSANPTAGNGTLTVYITYTIVTI